MASSSSSGQRSCGSAPADAWVQALGQVHRVCDADDGQAGALAPRPVKQVVQHGLRGGVGRWVGLDKWVYSWVRRGGRKTVAGGECTQGGACPPGGGPLGASRAGWCSLPATLHMHSAPTPPSAPHCRTPSHHPHWHTHLRLVHQQVHFVHQHHAGPPLPPPAAAARRKQLLQRRRRGARAGAVARQRLRGWGGAASGGGAVAGWRAVQSGRAGASMPVGPAARPASVCALARSASSPPLLHYIIVS